jgi:hypothetical protein
MSPTYLRTIATSCLFCLAGACLAAGCGGGGSSTIPTTGPGCTLSSDCQDPLICTAGRCHAQCAQSRDCDFGQRCVKIGTNNVCQLQSEARCAYNSDCTSPLVCAVDLQCRAQCQTDRDCTKGQVCTPTSKVCAEPSELNTAKELSLWSGAPDGGASPAPDAGPGVTPVDAPISGAPDVPKILPDTADAPLPPNSGPVDEFQTAWRSAVMNDAGVPNATDGGVVTVQVLATPAPATSSAAADPPRILLLGGQLVGSALQLSITYEATSAIASTIVAPAGANYFVRVTSPQPKTPAHPLAFALSLALPANLAELTVNGLAIQVLVALVDASSHVSSFLTLGVSFQHPDGGTGIVASAASGKVCNWSDPPTCLPDHTGLLVCAADERSVQVMDCQAGPPAFQCANGPDGGAAECVCPNRCALESKTCGKDSCGHDCGGCPAGAECDPLGNCHFRSSSGCADGTREAFTDTARFPSIAGCEVWWEGGQALRTPRSGQEWCGNATGIACKVPADGCAPGWHMCMQGGWPADIRDRPTYPSGIDAGAAKLSWVDCQQSNNGHFFVAASSSAYPSSQGGSCSAFPLGCYSDDVSGYLDTVACGTTTSSSGCNSAIWPSYTLGTGAPCTGVTITRTDQNGVLCCQDPEITGS